MDGVSFLVGNDIAGSLIVSGPTADVEKLYPNLYPLCAVTRSKARR